MINTMQMQLNPPLVYHLRAKLLGVAFENVRVSKACSFGKDSLQAGPRRGFKRQREPGDGYLSRVHLQLRVTPRNLHPDRTAAGQLAHAAIRALPGPEGKQAMRELWCADATLLFNVVHVAQRSLSLHVRARLLHLIQKIAKSRRLKWELPLARFFFRVPWLGGGTARSVARARLRSFMNELGQEYRGIWSLFDTRSLRIGIAWTSSLSLGEACCSAKDWNARLHENAWPCVCADYGPEWPRARNLDDGTMHVCAGQEEVPWPTELQCISSWSCRTRLRPTASRIKSCMQAAFLKVASARRLDKSPKIIALVSTYAADISQAAEADWRLLDLMNPTPCDATLIETPANLLRPLWVEVRDHATHRFQAICPAMALAAIQKT